jgi:signal transduction histidine kinase/HPt (histidine-containing phosphotransfer) domain-containing protein
MGAPEDLNDVAVSEERHLKVLESILSLDRALAAIPQDAPIEAMFKTVNIHLRRMFGFHAVGFFLVNPADFSYQLSLADPPGEESALSTEGNRAIEDGIFGWALRRNQALVQMAADSRQLVLHPLLAPRSTLGMLAALAPPDFNTSPCSLTFLSVVMSKVALVAQNRNLHADLRAHNQQLEQAVAQRTQEAVDAMHAAEAANRAKSEFLANVSHEIRTPLDGLVDLTGRLLQSGLAPTQRLYAETARGSAEALLAVVNDVLEFSKIEAGRLTVESIDFDLRDLIERLLAMMRPRAEEKRLEFVTVVSPEIPSALRGDPGRLRQVLVNLVGNAIKFTNAGTVRVRVALESEISERAQLRFHVDDTGIGIPTAAQELLFQRFSRADPSATREFGSTGLGLAISKQLVDLMGGQIGVRTQEGIGSEFWFSVWLAKQHPDGRQMLPASPSDSDRASGGAQTTEQADVAAVVDARVFDQALLLARLADDRAAAATVARSFLEDTPKQMELLESFSKVGDRVGIARQARTIYCAAATVGGIALAPIAIDLEKAGKAGDLASVGALVAQLQRGFQALKPAMAASDILRGSG